MITRKPSEYFLQMSQFHWHIVDSQSFPLTVPGFPELSQKGAYSEGQIYTTDDISDIVRYAGEVSLLIIYWCTF